MDALPLGLVGDGALRAAVAADREVTRMEGVRLDHLAQYLGEVSEEWEAPTPGPGVEQAVRLGGPGTPVVPEFAVCEVATALGLTQPAATGLCADVLDLAYRLRSVAGAVRCGELSFARARLIARRTRDLPVEQARLVEERLCTPRNTGNGPVPMAAQVAMSRLKSVTDQAVLTVRGPESAAEAEARVAESLWVRVSPAEPGAADVIGRLAAADAVRLDQRLDQIAGWLRQVGDDRPKPILRAVALGLLADPDLLQALADLRNEKSAAEASDSEETPPPPSPGPGEPNAQLSGPDEQAALDGLTGAQQAAGPPESTGPSPSSRTRAGCVPGTSPPVPTGRGGSPAPGVVRKSDPGTDPPPRDEPDAHRADGPPRREPAHDRDRPPPPSWLEPDADRADGPPGRETVQDRHRPPPPWLEPDADREARSVWDATDDDRDAEPAVPDPVRPPGAPDDQPRHAGTAVPIRGHRVGACWCLGEPSDDQARHHAAQAVHVCRPAGGSDHPDTHLGHETDSATDTDAAGLFEPPQLRPAGIAGCPPGVLEKFASISSTVLYLHLDRASDTWTEERGGALTSHQAKALVGHSKVSVRPVLDLAEPLSYTGYVAPPRLKEQLALLNAGYCPFPYCHRRARAGDVDHQIPAAFGGPTGTRNTHRPCRKHHRAKDKGGWRVVCPVVGIWVWTSPAGAVYLVTNGTTTQLNGITRHTNEAERWEQEAHTGQGAPPSTPRLPRADVPTTVKEAWTPPWDPWHDPEPLTQDEHDHTYGLLNA